MTKTSEELRVKLEGKTERTEIEAILNGTTVTALKAYMKEEGFDCTGFHTWKKADFVETIAVALMADIALSQPAEIATAECETSAQPKIVKFVVGKTYACIHSVCGMDWTGYKKNNYLCKYTIIARKWKFVTVRDELGDTAKRLLKTDNNGVEFIHPSGYYASFKHLVLFANAPTVEPEIPANAEIAQPENLYMDDSYSDAPGDNSCPDMDIPEMHTPDAIHADNHGFTIVHSELITPPDYTVYPDTITDECTYVTVYACDKPENHSSAAVVPYADFAHIRNFFRLIALYLRLWLAMNITPNKNPLDDFPDGLFTHYATRKKPRAKFRRAVFEVGSSYSASSYSTSKGLQSFTFLVTGRCVYEDTYNKRKNVMLFITCNSPDNHDFEGRGVIRFIDTDHGVEVYNDRRYYEMGCGWRVFSFRADKRDNAPFPFKNTTPGDPNYKPCGNATRFLSREFLNYSDNPDPVQEVHAEINDITPETKAQPKNRKHNPAPASDIEHKLIDTKDLHFAERRKALDHNAAVISSCMFPEAVISLLSSISLQAILQLGFHMRLFIAKPKGKKNVIAELFAKRLIEYRELRANVRSKPANINAKNSASVPDGVKFFVGARRQICFKFED